MAIATHLIMDLLRIITPEEVGEITTKHNGGKFLSLTELVNERVQQNVYRNFSKPIETSEEVGAKILPFRAEEESELNPHEEVAVESLGENGIEIDEEGLKVSLSKLAANMARANEAAKEKEHVEDENMSSFILIEKARLKRSQQALKQKEILELYTKNLSVDIEQIKGSDDISSQSKESGILVNKKHY